MRGSTVPKNSSTVQQVITPACAGTYLSWRVDIMRNQRSPPRVRGSTGTGVRRKAVKGITPACAGISCTAVQFIWPLAKNIRWKHCSDEFTFRTDARSGVCLFADYKLFSSVVETDRRSTSISDHLGYCSLRECTKRSDIFARKSENYA